MGKYFQVEAKPFILPSKQHGGNIADTKILADWTSFEVPKGGVRLFSIQIVYRGKNGAAATLSNFEIIWAKSNPDGSAPTSLGTVAGDVGAPAAGSPPWFNLVQGASHIEATGSGSVATDNDLIYLQVITPRQIARVGGYDAGPNMDLILQGEPNSGSNVGYDKLYCALISKGNCNWGASTLTVDGTMSTSSPILTVADVDARSHFAPQDVVYDEDDNLIGTIKSIDSATQITMEDNLASASANDKVLYNGSPIKIILGFEQ